MQRSTVAAADVEVAMRVLMVDDHLMFLQGLKNLLAVLAPELRVDAADTLSHAMELLQLSCHDLILLDWHLSECDGEEAMRRLREAQYAGRIVVLSGETNRVLVQRTIELGAVGFIPKRYTSEMMVAALGQVLEGRIFLPADALASSAVAGAPSGGEIHSDPRLAGLTARQIEVYVCAARGLPNKLIARELGIAESTVKTHLTAVYAAMGVANRTEAAYQAAREGIRIV
jgi:DNA-binding NarL/FixJ family response regulator